MLSVIFCVLCARVLCCGSRVVWLCARASCMRVCRCKHSGSGGEGRHRGGGRGDAAIRGRGGYGKVRMRSAQEHRRTEWVQRSVRVQLGCRAGSCSARARRRAQACMGACVCTRMAEVDERQGRAVRVGAALVLQRRPIVFYCLRVPACACVWKCVRAGVCVCVCVSTERGE